MVRLHEHMRRQKQQVPRRLRPRPRLLDRSARDARACSPASETAGTAASCRRSGCTSGCSSTRRYGSVGLFAFPYFAIFELLGPFIETLRLPSWSIAVVPARDPRRAVLPDVLRRWRSSTGCSSRSRRSSSRRSRSGATPAGSISRSSSPTASSRTSATGSSCRAMKVKAFWDTIRRRRALGADAAPRVPANARRRRPAQATETTGRSVAEGGLPRETRRRGRIPPGTRAVWKSTARWRWRGREPRTHGSGVRRAVCTRTPIANGPERFGARTTRDGLARGRRPRR